MVPLLLKLFPVSLATMPTSSTAPNGNLSLNSGLAAEALRVAVEAVEPMCKQVAFSPEKELDSAAGFLDSSGAAEIDRVLESSPGKDPFSTVSPFPPKPPLAVQPPSCQLHVTTIFNEEDVDEEEFDDVGMEVIPPPPAGSNGHPQNSFLGWLAESDEFQKDPKAAELGNHGQACLHCVS